MMTAKQRLRATLNNLQIKIDYLADLLSEDLPAEDRQDLQEDLDLLLVQRAEAVEALYLK